MGGQSAGGVEESAGGVMAGEKRLVGSIVKSDSNQRLPWTAPDDSALLPAFEANRCKRGLAYR